MLLGNRTRQSCSNRPCTTGARMRRRGFHPQILRKRQKKLGLVAKSPRPAAPASPPPRSGAAATCSRASSGPLTASATPPTPKLLGSEQAAPAIVLRLGPRLKGYSAWSFRRWPGTDCCGQPAGTPACQARNPLLPVSSCWVRVPPHRNLASTPMAGELPPRRPPSPSYCCPSQMLLSYPARLVPQDRSTRNPHTECRENPLSNWASLRAEALLMG